MSEINGNSFNPNKDIKVQQSSSFDATRKNVNNEDRVEKQQTDAASPAYEALGRSAVKVDNFDADMARLMAHPELAEVSDGLFNAAMAAGLDYPKAATFATFETM